MQRNNTLRMDTPPTSRYPGDGMWPENPEDDAKLHSQARDQTLDPVSTFWTKGDVPHTETQLDKQA